MQDDLFLRLIGRTERDSAEIVVEAFGPGFPMRQFREEYNTRTDELIAAGPVPLKEGVLDLLEFLESSGIPKVVATSTRRARTLRLLAVTGLGKWFPAIVTGDQVEKGKPAPDIFLAAASAIGVPPENCAVLEDSEPGILAAGAGGFIPILVPGLKPPVDGVAGKAYAVCPTLVEAKSILEKIAEPSRDQFTRTPTELPEGPRIG
jgi:HAD superfamily hydrolase (TIGR01509 family)